MVGSAENKASSAPIELGLGLCLAIMETKKNHGLKTLDVFQFLVWGTLLSLDLGPKGVSNL